VIEVKVLRGFFSSLSIVLAKDLRIEVRTREIVTTAGFFAVLVAIMTSASFFTGPKTTERVGPGVIWLAVAFSSVLALGRTWQREREESALLSLLVAPIPRGAIFLGKALGVMAFVIVCELLLVPIVALLFQIDLTAIAGHLALVMVLGTAGVAAMGTLFGAMTVRTRARDLVLATVLFPLLSPMLISGVAATREIFASAASGRPVLFSDYSDYLILLGLFDFVAIAGGLALFGALLED
jgi:heme exporter protein B